MKQKIKMGGMGPIDNKIEITVIILDNTKNKNNMIVTYNNVVVNKNDDIIESIYLIDDNTHLDKNDKISIMAKDKDKYIFSNETYQQKELISGDTILVHINKKTESNALLTHLSPIPTPIPIIVEIPYMYKWNYDRYYDGLNKHIFRILTHNIGGQSKLKDDNTTPEFIVADRGDHQWNKQYNNWVEELNKIPKGLYPHSINIPSDIYCFQEFIKPGEVIGDLAFHIPKEGKDEFNINKSSYRLHNRTLELHNIEKQTQSPIQLYNFHGRVLSPTSSLSQLLNLLDLFSDINNSTNGYYKMIIGDFNFDFHAYYNNYLIDGIPYQTDINNIIGTIITNTPMTTLIETYPQYQYQFESNDFNYVINLIFSNLDKELYHMYHNFVICLDKWIPTNTWKINKNNTQRHTCIDYLLISKSLSTIIDSISYTPYWEYKVSSIDELEDRQLMINDFDHVPILFTLVLKDNYQIRY